MTVTAVPGQRYYKTDPDCPGDRHRPHHRSFTRGCRCPETIAAQNEWLAKAQATYRGTAGALPADGDPSCRGKRHTATNDAWRRGCRCPGAVTAHDRARAALLVERTAIIERFRATGECSARSHDSLWAYHDRGCRCPLAIKLYRAWEDRKTERRRGATKPPDMRPTVGRIDLMMLLAGYPDQPTVGEYMVADIRLSQRIVPNGPHSGRRLTMLEISERLHCPDNTIYRARRERIRLREERTARRLADVRAKAERVARAIERSRG